MTMAFSLCGSSPAAFMRLSVSRQEMPASTSTLAAELESTVQLPLLPLANTVMRIATVWQHSGKPALHGSSKLVNTKENSDRREAGIPAEGKSTQRVPWTKKSVQPQNERENKCYGRRILAERPVLCSKGISDTKSQQVAH